MLAAESQSVLLNRALDHSEVHFDDRWTAALISKRSPTKRSPNEDSAFLYRLPNGGIVLAVADGCGGMKSGEKASRLALTTLIQNLDRATNQNASVRNSILDGIERANDRILKSQLGSACTIAVVEIQANRMRSYHVGDSMIMVVNRRQVRYESISHSPVGYAVGSGLLPTNKAMFHEDRHLVSNVLGYREMRIEIGPTLAISKHDCVIVASDGLSDNLHNLEIAARCHNAETKTTVSKLAKLASRRMKQESTTRPCKPDDLTIIAYQSR
jgi:PPM family protein phosphatase